MKKMSFIFTTALTFALLPGCGGSASPEWNTAPAPPPVTQPEPEVIIDDITCSSSYPISISHVTIANETMQISELIDGNKTLASNWVAPNIDTSLMIELTEPANVKQLVLTWAQVQNAHMFAISSSKDGQDWQLMDTIDQSSSNSDIPDVIDLINSSGNEITAKYLQLDLAGDALSQASELLEIELFGCAENVDQSIELVDWYLSVPTDEDSNGRSDSISETELESGYYDPRFFSQSADGGLIFATSVKGYKTSTNTKYVRSELREMLRRGNTNYSTQGVNQNNWVFSSAPQSDIDLAGAVDGVLHAELAVNHVTTTGEDYQIGRVIIGQIHANDDEPIRLYYRKLPNNQNGAIYFAHEILGGDDLYIEMIGTRSNSASNPANGIPLNEKFSYTIEVLGNTLNVKITKADGSEFTEQFDMSDSGYDVGGQYMYFKAGVYNQNNSGDQHDYVKATFYKIENSHTGYDN
ncbi:hypothetical protein tloyanaT_17510 [Thalassotalea loyana]|uniref:F5/8 type C domain-containing protein n=1 Tax=Thalassotalea loyana TaxID=280483 RepID=A0ABQ6HBY8_9GAMM|nr:polysaccharide lyase family 7 protein [Thalassotalea loyana]GLX85499.1 hypothetical protein tloyanaT_17510 [Thalassotalea loyana]